MKVVQQEWNVGPDRANACFVICSNALTEMAPWPNLPPTIAFKSPVLLVLVSQKRMTEALLRKFSRSIESRISFIR